MQTQMSMFRDIPIGRKLAITGMLASGVALLLTYSAFVSYEAITYKESLVTDLSSAAAIVGYNSSAALVFDDPDSAARTLESLSTHESIIGAALFDRNGELFAQYRRTTGGQSFRIPPVEPEGYGFADDRLRLFRPFDFAGEPAGTVYIESDTERLRSRMSRYGLLGALAMLISSGVAFLLSARMHRAISAPISDLAGVAAVVRTEHNYSVRATKQSDDELGSLIDGFNAMLDQIQAQDHALQDARDHLERRVAERTRELEETHRELAEASRQAGMAEVATNVLHNVGNVLNSVNVSASVIAEQAEQSRILNLSKLAAMFDEHADDLAAFLTQDQRGRRVPAYLAQLSEHLLAERELALRELGSLRKNIDHIKGIVTMQQTYSKASGIQERLEVASLIEDAVGINAASLQRHGIEIVRAFGDAPPLMSEKHKILLILVNLVRNAKDACKASGRKDKRIAIAIGSGDGRVKISVADNGVGIAAENMKRIFAHGFTTKPDGHGFGLHSSALAAQDLGGALGVESGGPGRGAVFTLDLPLEKPVSVAA
jgi:two-component system, NtrC family, sensor kinase